MQSNRPVPKYVQVKNEIRGWITSGRLTPGDKIPTENELAQEFDISRHTVRQAVSELVYEGLLSREQGRGTFLSHQERSFGKPSGTTGKSGMIGVITTYISDYIFPSIIRGIESALSENGYSVLLASTENNPALEEKALKSMMEKQVDGIIVEPTKSSVPNSNIINYFSILNRNVPIIGVHAMYPELDVPCVRIDDENASMELTQHLIENNHIRIGGVFKTDDLQGKYRMKGFVNAIQASGLSIHPEVIHLYETEEKERVAKGFLDKFLSLPEEERPTAVVCYNDEIAFRLCREFSDAGISIPASLSVASFDNSPLADAGQVKLTTIDHPKYAMGKQVAEMILEQINAFHSGRAGRLNDIVMPSELIVRESIVNNLTSAEKKATI